ncbi:MAG: hypothetical protein ACP5VE_11685 [Chthonomonadales bacterium]
MGQVLTVRYGEGDVIEQLFQLKVSALRNHDVPALWRLTEELLDLAISVARAKDRWPARYVTESRLFDVPVDFVRSMPHLLCEDYVVYPYAVKPPRIILPH